MMDSNGFIVGDIFCTRCGKKLGTVNPAENYAGTYTGLCYTCEGSPPRVEARYPLDNSALVSHPPSLPSWRREREKFYWFEDCQSCRMGSVNGSSNNGYTIKLQCTNCGPRYWNNTTRAWLSWLLRTSWDAAYSSFDKHMIDAGFAVRKRKKTVYLEGADEEFVEQLKFKIFGRYRATGDRIAKLQNKIDPEVKVNV